jgi:hypothetical protein
MRLSGRNLARGFWQDWGTHAIPKVILISISPFQKFEIRSPVTPLDFPVQAPDAYLVFTFTISNP